jgi:hypothetical protein
VTSGSHPERERDDPARHRPDLRAAGRAAVRTGSHSNGVGVAMATSNTTRRVNPGDLSGMSGLGAGCTGCGSGRRPRTRRTGLS